jgi:hypothetical protein
MMFLTKMDGYQQQQQQKCDRNKNVISERD